MSEAEADEIALGWRANIVRVPLNQEWILSGCEAHQAETYLREIDTLVSWYAARGAYVLLVLHWLDDRQVFGLNRDGSANRVPPLPNQNSPAALETLAARYREEPAVLFEIFNEPHGVSMDDWKRWAQRLLDAIGNVHPDAVVFVPGIDWAYDLRGMPLDMPDAGRCANIVYSTHVYSRSHLTGRRRWRRHNRASAWAEAFGTLAEQVPVFVSEWGGDDAALLWGRELASYMDRLALGWTAWSWSDRPRLVADAQRGDYTPTRFGDLVRATLIGPTMEI
jgi:hypothetical protein